MTTATKAEAKLLKKIARLEGTVKELEARPVRDRGPKSKRNMTEDDAREIMIGKLKEVSHRKCAEGLGLSYGQVYSARNGFTFKAVYKEARK